MNLKHTVKWWIMCDTIARHDGLIHHSFANHNLFQSTTEKFRLACPSNYVFVSSMYGTFACICKSSAECFDRYVHQRWWSLDCPHAATANNGSTTLFGFRSTTTQSVIRSCISGWRYPPCRKSVSKLWRGDIYNAHAFETFTSHLAHTVWGLRRRANQLKPTTFRGSTWNHKSARQTSGSLQPADSGQSEATSFPFHVSDVAVNRWLDKIAFYVHSIS